MVETNADWPEAGVKDTDSPWEAPVAERVTGAGLPPVRETETVTLPLAPCASMSELGVSMKLNPKGWATVDVAVLV